MINARSFGLARILKPRARLRPRAADKATSAPCVIHVVKHCGYGNGNVHVAIDLACVQARAGYRVLVVSGGGTFVPLLEQHGVQHVQLKQEQRRPHTLLHAAYRLARLSRQTRASVIHSHMMGSALIGYVASLVTGIPLVTTVHNSFDRHSVIMRLGKRVVAVSDAEREHLIAQGYRSDRVLSIRNAPANSPRENFMKNDRIIELARPNIVAICGLHRRKGVFDLIEACTALLAEFREWTLYIAGEGPDGEALRKQVSDAGLAGRIQFLGFIPAPKSVFLQADIFVLASYADPCSLSIGEARAAGCAIIATAVGGTPEMLDHGAAGRLIPPGSPARLAQELRLMMTDPSERTRIREAAFAGSEVFDVTRLVGQYEAAYRAACDASARPFS